MNIVIIEDESLAAERLREMIQEIQPDSKIVAMLSTVKQSVEWLNQNKPDLIFLDIQLSDGNSFEIFQEVTVAAPIIFTTAYDQYAIEAFKVNSIDYLLKPIRQDELRASLDKFRKIREAFQPDLSGLLEAMQQPKPEYKKRFLLQYGETLRKIETKDIAYFYAQDKYVYLVTFAGQTLPIDHSLSQLESMLDPDHYFRINRQMIICDRAIFQMHAFSRSRIKIDLSPKAPKGIESLVSIERSPLFKEWLDK